MKKIRFLSLLLALFITIGYSEKLTIIASTYTDEDTVIYTNDDLTGDNVICDYQSEQPISSDFKKVYQTQWSKLRATSIEYYIIFKSDGMLLSNSSGSSALSKTRYSAGNSNDHYYQTWSFSEVSSGNYVIYVNYDQTKCLTADPAGKTISVGTYSGDSNQLWSMSISSSGNALQSESTDSRISGYKLYYASSKFTLSNQSFTPVGFYNLNYFVPLTSLSIASFFLAPNESRYIYPTRTPSNASGGNSNYSWSYSTTYISISASNLATGKKPNTSLKITVTDRITQISASCYAEITEISNGEHFIMNRTHNRMVQLDDNTAPNYNTLNGIMEIFPLDNMDYQKWTFTHLKDGYYKIESYKNGYCITVPSDKTTTRAVNLILTEYSGLDTQKWRITKTANGSYKIKPKSSEGYTDYDLIMSMQAEGLYVDGLNIQQREYVDNSSYKDEWYIIKPNTEIIFEEQYLDGLCWAACARMAASKFLQSPISQSSLAVKVLLNQDVFSPSGSQTSQALAGGDASEIEEGLEYLLGGMDCYSANEKIYSAITLQNQLDLGYPIIVNKGIYSGSTKMSGHCYILYDYHWDSSLNTYVYDLYNPSYESDNYVSVTYQQLCYDSTSACEGIWDGIITFKVGNYSSTVDWTGT